MSKVLETGIVCIHGDILFLSYKTSPVMSNWSTFYLNMNNGKSINLFAPSVTQWHYSPIDKDLENELVNLIQHAEEVKDISANIDIWYRKKYEFVIKNIG